MVPQSIEMIDTLVRQLVGAVAKKKGKIFQLIEIPQMTETERENPLLQRVFEVAHKTNEIITFLNNRFQL